MNEPIIDPAGPGLGSLRVYVRQEDAEDAKDRKPVPIWRLRNHQADMWMMAQASIHATARYRVKKKKKRKLIKKKNRIILKR